MRPSETERGKAWLTNFLPEDRLAATALLDGITFVSLSTMRSALLRELATATDSDRIEHPAVLVPALSLEDINPPEDSRQKRVGQPHIAYETFDVGGPILSTPGSEGFIGNTIRDLLNRHNLNTGWLPPTSTLAELRAQRCRSIVLVTDYAGTGNQLVEFARTFTRHPTIRSWRSGGLVRIHAVAYSVSAPAARLLNRSAAIDVCHSTMAAPTFDDRPWPLEVRESVEELCLRKAPRKASAHGYKNSRGLFATEAGAPNNLPQILRRVGANWNSFFEGRNVPPDLASALGDYDPSSTPLDLAVKTGQIRLTQALSVHPPARQQIREMLKLLAHLNRRRADRVVLASSLQIELAHVDKLLDGLKTLGLIDETFRLTERGSAELSAGKAAERQVPSHPSPRDDDYYPTSMR